MRALTGSLCIALWLAVSPLSADDLKGLTRDLKAKDPDVRRTAASELGKLGVEAKGAADALMRALTDLVKDRNRSGEVRRLAIESLGKIGPPAKSAVPALVDLLKVRGPRRPVPTDMEQVVRLEAVQTLGKIGPDAQAAVKTLEEL